MWPVTQTRLGIPRHWFSQSWANGGVPFERSKENVYSRPILMGSGGEVRGSILVGAGGEVRGVHIGGGWRGSEGVHIGGGVEGK